LLDQEGQELIVTMRDNGMRLLKLINDLLDLVRLEEGRVKIEQSPVELDSFIRGVAASVQHTASTRGIHLSVDFEPGLPLVQLDRDKLEKTLLNLLFNALKFTDAGGQVVLKVIRDGNELVLSVSDTGIGISEEHLGQLFQRFWQADGSSHRKHQGAGIGLSLVKEFTEAQGGTVHVESELGRGTTFYVRLPLVEASGMEAAEAEGSPDDAESVAGEGDSWLQSLYREAQLSPAGGQQPAGNTALYSRSGIKTSTVLVADDEPDMLRFVRAQLGGEHRIVSARNGREAVEMARAEQPSVIVLDMMMPEMDGLEACSILREDAATAHIPIIMLTARADEETKLSALAAGANDFIAKPFSVTELQVRVRNLMDSHFSRLELAEQNQTLEETLEMLRETEMQLLQSEKLASIGELSAGMSHEVKNPLNYALTGIYALKNLAATLPEAERVEYQDLVATVEEGVRRVMDTVNTLRELVHPHVENRQEFRVEEVVDAATRLLRAEWNGRVAIHKSIDEDTWLFANKSMVLLVFLNLLKNAMDALRERASSDGEPAIWIEGENSGGVTVVRVRDNGPGISPENQSKVFDILGMGDLAGEAGGQDPGREQGRVFKHFFSTKAPGSGMGMGLSICRRIVRAHGGAMSFRSEPGQLCEFTMEFPAHQPVEMIV
jgi:signal transduction histidine kinase